MTGEAFFDARMVACRAVAADVGESWHLVEGASYWCTIPAKLRSFKTARGTKIQCHRDARLPAGRYWPAGALPDGLIVVPDYARERTPRREALTLAAAERRYGGAYTKASDLQRRCHNGRYGAAPNWLLENRAEAIRHAWELRRDLIEARRAYAAMAADVALAA